METPAHSRAVCGHPQERHGAGLHRQVLQAARSGIYRCVCCGNALFTSDTKFESGTGWPSFWAPIAKENITEETDTSFGMMRTEVEGDPRRNQSPSSAVPRSAAAIGTTNLRHTADSRFKAEPTGAHLHAIPGVESIPRNGAQRIACENGSLSDRTGPHAHFH